MSQRPLSGRCRISSFASSSCRARVAAASLQARQQYELRDASDSSDFLSFLFCLLERCGMRLDSGVQQQPCSCLYAPAITWPHTVHLRNNTCWPFLTSRLRLGGGTAPSNSSPESFPPLVTGGADNSNSSAESAVVVAPTECVPSRPCCLFLPLPSFLFTSSVCIPTRRTWTKSCGYL